MMVSCKKDAEKISVLGEKDSTALTTLDSIQIPTFEDPVYSAPFVIVPQIVSSEKGRTVFSENGKVLFYFDQNANEGIINIDQKKYALTKFSFNENRYAISGDGVEIQATEGDFKSAANDCLQGKFPEIEVTLNNKTLNIPNVSVEDCPIY